MKTFYATISARYVSRPNPHYVPAVFVSDDRADSYGTGGPHDVARYEIECRSKSEVHAIGRSRATSSGPSIMTVRETWHRDGITPARRSAAGHHARLDPDLIG